MAVDDHSLNRAARVCAGRDQGECRPSNPAQWCTRQGEVGLREGEWSRAYRERDRRRADEEAKHDGDRSRVCDARACASVSSGKTAKASPMASEDFGRDRQKRRRYGHIIVPMGIAIEICVCDLNIHQNIRDYNRRSEQRTHADQSFGPLLRLLCTRTVSSLTITCSCNVASVQSRGTKRKIGCRSVTVFRAVTGVYRSLTLGCGVN